MRQQLVQMNIAPRPDARGGIEFRDDIPHLITTQQFDWPGMKLEAGANNIVGVDDAVGANHYLSLNLDERPVTLEVKNQLGEFRRVVLRRGAAWFNPAGEVCSLRVQSDFRYVRVAVDPLYFNRLVSGGNGNAIELRRSFGITKSQIGHILGALVAESDAGNPGGLAFVEALATGLSHQIAILAGVHQPRARRWRGGLSVTAKSRVLELMDTRLCSNLSIEFLAREVGLSPAHFARAFKETMGVAPHRYLLQLRLERGRRLLENVDAALADVAQRSGFADQAHFTRLFKREYGVTPGVVLRSRRRLPPTRE